LIWIRGEKEKQKKIERKDRKGPFCITKRKLKKKKKRSNTPKK